jgi:hypothetical protein
VAPGGGPEGVSPSSEVRCVAEVGSIVVGEGCRRDERGGLSQQPADSSGCSSGDLPPASLPDLLLSKAKYYDTRGFGPTMAPDDSAHQAATFPSLQNTPVLPPRSSRASWTGVAAPCSVVLAPFGAMSVLTYLRQGEEACACQSTGLETCTGSGRGADPGQQALMTMSGFSRARILVKAVSDSLQFVCQQSSRSSGEAK